MVEEDAMEAQKKQVPNCRIAIPGPPTRKCGTRTRPGNFGRPSVAVLGIT